MFLLWAGHVVVQNAQFTHFVPHHHVLTLIAKKITGKKILDVEDVKGQYVGWFFTARHIVLNTVHQVAVFDGMTLDCKKPSVRIQAQSGTLNLQTYNAMVGSSRLTHRNLVFICPKASYDHHLQKITCWNGVVRCHS